MLIHTGLTLIIDTNTKTKVSGFSVQVSGFLFFSLTPDTLIFGAWDVGFRPLSSLARRSHEAEGGCLLLACPELVAGLPPACFFY